MSDTYSDPTPLAPQVITIHWWDQHAHSRDQLTTGIAGAGLLRRFLAARPFEHRGRTDWDALTEDERRDDRADFLRSNREWVGDYFDWVEDGYREGPDHFLTEGPYEETFRRWVREQREDERY